jgi:hypothetical protein
MIKIVVLIKTPKEACLEFAAIVHESDSVSGFYLDPVEFYQKWGGEIPHGNHLELEIIGPGEAFFRDRKLHVHASARSSNPFVCYPRQIETLERALMVFRIWCVGTVGFIEAGIDLNVSYSQECNGDDSYFFQYMREKYGIEVTSEIIVGK